MSPSQRVSLREADEYWGQHLGPPVERIEEGYQLFSGRLF